MSPRAAWQLEALGFSDIYDYVVRVVDDHAVILLDRIQCLCRIAKAIADAATEYRIVRTLALLDFK